MRCRIQRKIIKGYKKKNGTQNFYAIQEIKLTDKWWIISCPWAIILFSLNFSVKACHSSDKEVIKLCKFTQILMLNKCIKFQGLSLTCLRKKKSNFIKLIKKYCNLTRDQHGLVADHFNKALADKWTNTF